MDLDLEPTPTAVAAPFLATPPEELASLLGSFERAKKVWQAVARGVDPFEWMAHVDRQGSDTVAGKGLALPPDLRPHQYPFEKDLPELGRRSFDRLRAAFPAEAAAGQLQGGTCEVIDAAEDGTTKMLLRLTDGLMVEAVLIPTPDRTTLCVSSQVGCARACAFCSTGKMGLIRNLQPHEILQQLNLAIVESRQRKLPPLTNIVFMGMGEPTDNLECVEAVIKQMTHNHAFALGRSHISLSTVGPSPEHITALEHVNARLAWSVHAAQDSVRRVLVPTTRHTMTELRDAFAKTLRQRKDKCLFVEIALVEGINDGPDHAASLADLLRPLPGKTRINLLPYNPFAPDAAALPAKGRNDEDGEIVFRTPNAQAVRAFQQVLQKEGFLTTVRATRGADKAAACGQLVSATSLKASRRKANPL